MQSRRISLSEASKEKTGYIAKRSDEYFESAIKDKLM